MSQENNIQIKLKPFIENGRLELVDEIFNNLVSSEYFIEFTKFYKEKSQNFIILESEINCICKIIIDKKDEYISTNIPIDDLIKNSDIDSIILKMKYIIKYMIFIATTKEFKNIDNISNSMFITFNINRQLIGFYFLLLGYQEFFKKFFSNINMKSCNDSTNLTNLTKTLELFSIEEKTYLFNEIYNFNELKYLSDISLFVNSVYKPFRDAMPTYHEHIHEYFYGFINSFRQMQNIFIF